MITMLIALGCGDKDPGDSGTNADSGSNTDSGGEEEAFAPTWGTWTTVDGDIENDTCNFPDDGGDTGSETSGSDIELASTGEGTFTIAVDDEDGTSFTFNCTLTEWDFACDTQVVIDEDFDGELAAQVTGSSSPNGSFSDENTLSGRQVVEVTCEGDDCGQVTEFTGIDFPCGFEMPFTATYTGGE